MLSAIVLTKNEEKNISKCLDDLSWCDEILVVDDNSVDKTIDIAKKQKASVLQHGLQDFASQRNFGLEHAKGEWIFFVDADERVSQVLRDEICQVIESDSGDGYLVKRNDCMWNKKLSHGEVGDIWLLRLAKKGKGKWSGRVHEAWKVHGKIGKLKNPLYHYPHQTIAEFIAEINFYSSLRAEELKAQGVHASFVDIVLYPKAKFFFNYFFKGGFLDGNEGLVLAIMMSLHSFLVRGKLWLLWQRKSG